MPVIPARPEYLWLQDPRIDGHVKAGTPPKATPLRSNDSAAKRGAAALSFAKK